VFVDEKFRGQGVARRLVELAIAQRPRSIRRDLPVSLSVESKNASARSLYETLGFETWGTEPRAMKSASGKPPTYDTEDHMALLL